MRSVEDAWEAFRIGSRTANGLIAHAGQRFPAEHFVTGAYAWSTHWPDTERAAPAALTKVIRRIGPCHVIAHSSGSGTTLQVLFELATNQVHSLCLVEPAGLPEVTRFPDVPLTAVWGNFADGNESWTALRNMSRAACTASSLSYDELLLSETGFWGHTHLPMQDCGNEQVLGVILERRITPLEAVLTAARRKAGS